MKLEDNIFNKIRNADPLRNLKKCQNCNYIDEVSSQSDDDQKDGSRFLCAKCTLVNKEKKVFCELSFNCNASSSWLELFKF